MLLYHIHWSGEKPSLGLAPAAVLLHGWGGDESSMAVFETAFPPGWLLVRPRAPYPLLGNGYAWYRTTADGEPDPHTIAESLAQLRQLLAELPQGYPIDPQRWLLVGFSQGGAMAARLALEVPERIAGLAVFSGFLLEPPEPTPPSLGFPVFVAHGLHDPLVPIERARQLCEWLQRLGAETTCVEYVGGHKAAAEAWRAFKSWLSRIAHPQFE
ncbi:MAG: alpha/beta hydrolase [Thermoflexus sp.]